MNQYGNTNFGIEILGQAHDLKLMFDGGGREGRISYVKASICAGTTGPEEIVEAAARISGPWIRGEMETIINEGENIHWGMDASGRLYVIED